MTMLTRTEMKRYFEAYFDDLAGALRAARMRRTIDGVGVGQHEQWKADVRAVAGVCAEWNNNFDQSRFFERAGYDEE